MKRDTRLAILHMAKKQFNERGFNAVSTRDIADTLGISKGNLTYYFKKKEDIMEAILAEFPASPFKTPQTLAELDGFLLHMQQVVEENAFYFWHHAQLSELSPRIQGQQHHIYQDNVEKLMAAFQILRGKGFLYGEEVSGQYRHVIDTLLLSCIYWLPFCRLKQQEPIPADRFRKQAWLVLYPLLTETGRESLRKIIYL